METGALVRAVKRNPARFSSDFMFQLTAAELAVLRCQIGTSKTGRGGRRYRPYAFTEQGVAMLSSVLRSPRAVAVNVEIMCAFVRLRSILAGNADLARQLAALERKYDAPVPRGLRRDPRADDAPAEAEEDEHLEVRARLPAWRTPERASASGRRVGQEGRRTEGPVVWKG